MDAVSPDASTNDARPAKRQRSDDPNPDHSVPRSSEFWLDDGTVVIRASDLEFRVHRSTLSMQSEFFKNMFEIPQSEDAQTICGSVVVDVTDKSEDWDALLKMLYRPLQMMQQVESLPYSFFAAAIRLGKKYDFATIAQASLDHLKKTFQDPRTCTVTGDLATVLSVLEVVEDLRIDILRPGLYYWCLKNLTLLHIVNGTVDQQGNSFQLPRGVRDTLVECQDTARLSFIKHCWFPLFGPGGKGVSPNCPQHMYYNPGPMAIRRCSDAIHQHITSILSTPMTLYEMENPTVPGICAPCQSQVSSIFSEHLDAFFNQLPACFKMKEYLQLEDYAE